ncbi:MAG: Mammalian cell entry related domain protein [Pedosphaera sp.]|nr:Mammalian cell entry related domain protein [Pedosphaera sp.]
MSASRKEIKVGFFVLICLALLAFLLMQFGKGSTLFRPTYTIRLTAGNVGGLRARSTVLMAGVPVGTISKIQLNPDGKSVTMYLKIYEQYDIHKDARFVIEQSGFLGDQFVAIYPTENKAPKFLNNEEAHAQEPFNLQEVARSASGFIQRLDETAKKLNDAINDVRRLVLNEQTLTNLSITVGTFRHVSEDAQTTVQGINNFVTSNAVPVSIAVSNLVQFTERLNILAESAQNIVNTNGPQISAAINNVQASTVTLTNLLNDVQSGKGFAGSLLKNDQLSANFSLLASNLAVTSSNLNRLGLWAIIRKPKQPKEEPPPSHQQPAPGRNPFK